MKKFLCKGLATKLHDLMELHAINPNFRFICLAEESHKEHPLKPVDFKENAKSFFVRQGYKETGMVLNHTWSTIQADNSVKQSVHPLRYWIKTLTD